MTAQATSVTINGKPCVQNQGVVLDSTDTNFVCWTPPLFPLADRTQRAAYGTGPAMALARPAEIGGVGSTMGV